MMDSKLVGVISDTHGVIRAEALQALVDADLIIHAGDVGSNSDVLDALAGIAPVHAVRGNIDTDPSLPETLTVEVMGFRIFVVHRIADLNFDPATEGFSAVITGHSHRPSEEVRDGVLYLNPGSAGPRRFRLPVTLALLSVNEKGYFSSIVTLSSLSPC